jgi:hypothetical protein
MRINDCLIAVKDCSLLNYMNKYVYKFGGELENGKLN